MSKLAISDKKIIYIEQQNQHMYILNGESTDKKTQIGRMDESCFIGLTDKQLDDYELHMDRDGNVLLSLNEFKSIFKSFIQLTYGEKFMQAILHHMVYTEEKGWKLEYSYKDKNEELYRIDMINQISSSFPRKEHQTLMMVENKNFNSQKDDVAKILKDAQIQLDKYANDMMANEVNLFSFDETAITAQIFIYDANYFFNNPYLIENIHHYISNNNEYFKCYAYTYTYNLDNGFKVKSLTQKSVMDVLFILDEHYDKQLETYTVNAYPFELQKVNRSSNPRALDRMESVQLSCEMVDNILDAIDKGKPYIPTHYTQQKQIHVYNEFYTSKIKNKLTKCIYGHGLSLSNGQHSVEGYTTTEDILIDRNPFLYSHKDYNKLKEKIAKLKDKIVAYKMKVEDITSKFIIQAKIVPASSRQEEKSLAVASNRTVGEVDTNPILANPLFIRINEDWWEYKKLHPEFNKIIQISIPRIIPPKNTFVIQYYILMQLTKLKEKNFFQQFRSNGGKKSGLLLLKGFFGNTEDSRRYDRLINRKSQILNQLDDDILSIEEIGELEQEKDDIINELREFDFYDINNLNIDKYNVLFKDLIIFANILNMTQSLMLSDPKDMRYTQQKLAFGIIYNYVKANINMDMNNEDLLRRVIIYSNIIVYSLNINKNSIFNSKKHTVIVETLFECLDNSKQIGYEDMKAEFTSQLENKLSEKE